MTSRGLSAEPGVLLVGNHAPPYGGVPNHVAALARHLAAQGWRVHVLADICERRGRFEVDGYTVHAPSLLQRVAALLSRPPASARTYLRRHINRSAIGDVARANIIRRLIVGEGLNIISSYHLLKPGLSASWVAEALQMPLVITVFGEIYARHDEHLKRIDDVRHVLDASTERLSCSQHCADSVATLGLAVPIKVLHYGVDLRKFDCPPRMAQDIIEVLYVGRMVSEMGLAVLLEAADQILEEPRALIRVVGASGPLTAAAESLAQQHPHRVSVHPDLDDTGVLQRYAAASVVVAPSTNERACLGLAIVEAMAAGLPVVACSVGGTAEVVQHTVTGTLINPDDARELADAVALYIRDPDLRIRHGKAGRARAEQHFDLTVTNRRCTELFTRLLSTEGTQREEYGC